MTATVPVEDLVQQQLAATAPSLPPFLRPGVHMIVWPRDGWAKIDPQALAADLVALGCVGAIPQASAEAPTWIATHRAPLEAAGLQVSAGLGRVTAPAILAALAEGCDVVLDEEDWHRVDDVRALTDAVLSARPDVPSHITDCMYPAVQFWRDAHGVHHPTGHAAITQAFNRLCGGDRFPQCYAEQPPIRDGLVARSLAWARDPSQWPSIGVSASRVRPTVQAYDRSVADHLRLFAAETTVLLWDYCEMDASTRMALQLRRLRPDVDPATVGPELARDLGLDVPAGVVWTCP